MKKYLCLRARNSRDAKLAINIHQGKVIRSNPDADPAFRNMLEALTNKGLKPEIDDCRLFCFLVEDPKNTDFYQFNEVELEISDDWFEAEKSKVRHLVGAAYCEATAKLADEIPMKDQKRKIKYQIPKEMI